VEALLQAYFLALEGKEFSIPEPAKQQPIEEQPFLDLVYRVIATKVGLEKEMERFQDPSVQPEVKFTPVEEEEAQPDCGQSVFTEEKSDGVEEEEQPMED
jgi:hypothetical protein